MAQVAVRGDERIEGCLGGVEESGYRARPSPFHARSRRCVQLARAARGRECPDRTESSCAIAARTAAITPLPGYARRAAARSPLARASRPETTRGNHRRARHLRGSRRGLSPVRAYL